jgi:hypothetical protein
MNVATGEPEGCEVGGQPRKLQPGDAVQLSDSSRTRRAGTPAEQPEHLTTAPSGHQCRPEDPADQRGPNKPAAERSTQAGPGEHVHPSG